MALNPIVDSRDVRFVLFELLEAHKLTGYPMFQDFDKDMFEDTLGLSEALAVNQIYPANAEGDKAGGAKYDPATKGVTIPEGYKRALDAYNESGFVGFSMEQELGGMGMPESIYQACNEYFTAASMAFSMYPALTIGATNLIITFGTEEQKAVYVGKMISGEWGGTMCLTEPDAGSDVGALKAKAFRQKDGTYLIQGQKIFISSGENDYYKNMVHPVLARIEGDPKGTKGISIFLVPKYHIKPDGSPGERNDVVCSGIEHKMGIKSSSTCTLNFGDNGKCVGYLLGEERKGMKIMFQMMNEARLYVALQGLAVSSAAYSHAVTYAKNRKQMAHVTQMSNPDAPQVAIIQHPDIKRMLIWMKSYVEAMRALVYFTGYNLDLAHAADGETAKEALALAEFLIPIGKAGNTDNCWLVTCEAIQVYGGYGFCGDYPVEQFARDSKIQTLYEGTNGIQSIDLAMRKLLMNENMYNYSVYKKRIADVVKKAKGVVDDKYIAIVERGVVKMDEVVAYLNKEKDGGKFLNIFACATPLQQAFTMLTYAWMHLWMLTLTVPAMKNLVGDKKGKDLDAMCSDNLDAAYFTGKVLSGEFYLGAEFHKFFGKAEYILSGELAAVKATDAIFTGCMNE